MMCNIAPLTHLIQPTELLAHLTQPTELNFQRFDVLSKQHCMLIVEFVENTLLMQA